MIINKSKIICSIVLIFTICSNLKSQEIEATVSANYDKISQDSRD